MMAMMMMMMRIFMIGKLVPFKKAGEKVEEKGAAIYYIYYVTFSKKEVAQVRDRLNLCK